MARIDIMPLDEPKDYTGVVFSDVEWEALPWYESMYSDGTVYIRDYETDGVCIRLSLTPDQCREFGSKVGDMGGDIVDIQRAVFVTVPADDIGRDGDDRLLAMAFRDGERIEVEMWAGEAGVTCRGETILRKEALTILEAAAEKFAAHT